MISLHLTMLVFYRHREHQHPQSLKVNKENEDSVLGSFLDLGIKVQENVIFTMLYDKCDAFSFEIVNVSNLSENIPQDHKPVQSLNLRNRWYRLIADDDSRIFKGIIRLQLV